MTQDDHTLGEAQFKLRLLGSGELVPRAGIDLAEVHARAQIAAERLKWIVPLRQVVVVGAFLDVSRLIDAEGTSDGRSMGTRTSRLRASGARYASPYHGQTRPRR